MQNRDRLRKRSEEEEKDVGPVTRYGFSPQKIFKIVKSINFQQEDEEDP